MTTILPIVVYSGPDFASEIVQDVMGDRYDVRTVAPEPDALYPQLAQAVAFLDASMKVPLTPASIAAAPALRLVSCATTGATHIDADALAARDIPLLTLKGQTEVLRALTPAAELSWALIMACARNLGAALSHVNSGGWERTEFPGMMLKGRTIGIIGFGRLGQWVGRYADAFGMTVLYHDPFQTDVPDYATSTNLEDLVAQADIISLHLHVTPETTGLVGADLIARFKPGSVFVNTSRSEVTDEAALADALTNGHIAAIGVDVLSDETDLSNSPLWRLSQTHSNVLITPHIGGFSPDAVRSVVHFAATRIKEHLEG
jgi:D-3-phosphoglycerate dehydrogenase